MTQRSGTEGEQFSTASGTGQSAGMAPSSSSDLSSGATSGATEQAREAIGQTADQVRQQASNLTGQAREQASTQLASQKDRAASSLGGVADALRQTGHQLSESDQGNVGQYAERAAQQVERFQGYLQSHDIGGIVDDVERMAREQPAVFLGSAFVLGLLGARFLKSSGERSGRSYGGTRSYTASSYGAGRYDDRLRSSTYPPGGTASTSAYRSPTGASTAGYGTARTSDDDFLASSLTSESAAGTSTTTGASGYSAQYGTGLQGAETSDRTSEAGTATGGTATGTGTTPSSETISERGRSREQGGTEGT